MRAHYASLYVHLVWATWDRRPLIADEWEAQLYAAIQQAAHHVGSDIVAIGGVADHVHVLATLPTTLAVADLAKQVKGSSSHFVSHALGLGKAFRWQGSYAGFTVSEECTPRIRAYTGKQREHHEWGGLDPSLELPY